MMYRSPSNFTPFLWVVIVLLGAGLIMGVLGSGSDLLNPKSSSARQAASNEATRHQNELNQLEEQQRAAELDVELERQRGKLANDLELQEYEAKLRAKFAVVRELILTIALVAIVSVLGAGMTMVVVRLGQQWLQTRQQIRAQPADEWESPTLRRLAREIGHIQSWLESSHVPTELPSQPTAAGENGRQRKPTSPLTTESGK
jgi:hypothetical protein